MAPGAADGYDCGMQLTRRTLLRTAAGAAALSAVGPSWLRTWVGQARAAAAAALPAGHWAAGDAHVHTDHSSDGSLPRQGLDRGGPGDTPVGSQLAIGAAGGLAWLAITDHRTYTQHWDPQWTSDRLLLLPGEEANGKPHATVVGAVDTLVDGAEPVGSPGFRHLQQSVWDVHAQDAVWGTAHPQDGEYEATGPGRGTVNANASTVGIDTVEAGNRVVDPDPDLDYCENRWNAGFRFGITTSSDSHFTEITPIQGPGTSRTLVLRTDDSERATLDALREGRTTTANGAGAPVLTLHGQVGEVVAVAGAELRAGRGAELTLRVRVERGVGTTVLLFAAPGRSAGPIATYRPALPDESYELVVRVAAAHGWYRAEARGVSVNAGAPGDPDGPVSVQAATSALFVDTGAPARPRPEIAVPPQVRRADGAALVLGGQGRFAGFADVARDGDVTHVVAERHDDAATRVVYRRLPGGVEVDLAPGSRTARLPRVAARESTVVVVWQDERAGQVPHRPQVYQRTSLDGGRTWQPERQVSAGTVRDERPAVALLGTRPVVAWQSNDPRWSGGAFEVVVRVGDDAPVAVSAPGKVVHPGDGVDARSARYPASLFPRLAVTPAGAVVVVWQDDRNDPDPLFTGHLSVLEGEAPDGTDPDAWQILASLRSPAGGWSAAVEVSDDPQAAHEHPDVAVDRDGTLHAVWDARPLKSSGVNPSIRASRSTGATTWSAAARVGAAPAAMSHRPRVSVDPDGTVRALWYDSRAADWRWRLATATHSSAGWGPARLLTDAGSSTWPALSAGTAVFTSDRGAQRVQRDRTSEIYLLELAGGRPSGTGAPAPGSATGRLPATGATGTATTGVAATVVALALRLLRRSGAGQAPPTTTDR